MLSEGTWRAQSLQHRSAESGAVGLTKWAFSMCSWMFLQVKGRSHSGHGPSERSRSISASTRLSFKDRGLKICSLPSRQSSNGPKRSALKFQIRELQFRSLFFSLLFPRPLPHCTHFNVDTVKGSLG